MKTNIMKHKPFVIIGALIVTALVGSGLYLYALGNQPDNSAPTVGGKEDRTPTTSAKDKIATQTAEPTAPQTAESSTETKPSNVQTAQKPLAAHITQASQDGDTIYIRALVEGATSGTCNLTMTNGSAKIEKSVPFGVQATYVICHGYNLSLSEFPSGGEWNISLTAVAKDGATTTTNNKLKINK